MSTKVWTYSEAVDFAKASAHMVLDDPRRHGTLEDTIAELRENIRDTLVEYQAAVYEVDAFAAFDAIVAGAY